MKGIRWSGDPLQLVHGLLLGLQVLGSFPYARSSSSPHYQLSFNVCLFLWSMFTSLLVVFGFYYEMISTFFDIDSVIGFATSVTSQITYTMHSLGYFLIIFYSRPLVQALHDLDNMFSQEKFPVKNLRKHLRYVDLKTLLFVLVNIFVCGFSANFYLTDLSQVFAYRMFLLSVTVIILTNTIISLLVYNVVLKLLGACITASTQDVTQGRPQESPHDHTADPPDTTLMRLFQLEKRIWQVSMESLPP